MRRIALQTTVYTCNCTLTTRVAEFAVFAQRVYLHSTGKQTRFVFSMFIYNIKLNSFMSNSYNHTYNTLTACSSKTHNTFTYSLGLETVLTCLDLSFLILIYYTWQATGPRYYMFWRKYITVFRFVYLKVVKTTFWPKQSDAQLI